MMKLRTATLAPYLLCFPIALACHGAAFAEDIFVYGTAGTGAAELGIGKALTDSVSLRGGIGHGYAGSYERNLGGNRYDIKPEASTSMRAMVDWFPLDGSGFRVSGGMAYSNKQTHNMTATPGSTGDYRINGNTYSAADVGRLRGVSTFRKFTPEIELGWESASAKKPGWRFISALNVQFKDVRGTTLSASGAANSPALAQDVAAEQKRVASDFGGTQFRLGVSVGAAYSF